MELVERIRELGGEGRTRTYKELCDDLGAPTEDVEVALAEAIRELTGQGLARPEIAKALGLGESTIRWRARTAKIEPTGKRGPKPAPKADAPTLEPLLRPALELYDGAATPAQKAAAADLLASRVRAILERSPKV